VVTSLAPPTAARYQTIGGAFENIAKHSENFAATTWDKNGGS
jgi:hypothetical protein